MEKFIDLPGPPDNIRLDGEGHYWIALAMVIAFFLIFKSNLNMIDEFETLAGKFMGMGFGIETSLDQKSCGGHGTLQDKTSYRKKRRGFSR